MSLFRRNKRCVNNCPKCGVFVCPGYQTRLTNGSLPDDIKNHECDPAFLKRSARATDAIMDRDTDHDQPRTRTEAERLAEGFEMMEEDDRYGDD